MSDDRSTNAGVAFGRPGIPPRWTSSAKEGVGTAYATASRVWFTLSHGILNEIYYPTIDRPQVRDMQFLITDGETFFHEEKRDLESTISYIEEHTLGYRIESTDRERRYRLIKEIVADPHQPCVLIHLQVEATLDMDESLANIRVAGTPFGCRGMGQFRSTATDSGHYDSPRLEEWDLPCHGYERRIHQGILRVRRRVRRLARPEEPSETRLGL